MLSKSGAIAPGGFALTTWHPLLSCLLARSLERALRFSNVHYVSPRRSMPGKLAEQAEFILDSLDAGSKVPVPQTRRQHPRYLYRQNLKLESLREPEPPLQLWVFP